MNFKNIQDKTYLVVAIDGISGSGKSSTAEVLAQNLKINHLNTGIMYRVVSYFADQRGILPNQTQHLIKLIQDLNFSFQAPNQICIQGEAISSYSINFHSTKVNSLVSQYSSVSKVRMSLVSIQQEIINKSSFVVEGRDISSTVCPQSQFKFFLWASEEIRSQRRLKQLKNNGETAKYQDILINLQNRDHKDSNRSCSPLSQDFDADLIDTSQLKFDEQVQLILNRIFQKMEMLERSMSNSAH